MVKHHPGLSAGRWLLPGFLQAADHTGPAGHRCPVLGRRHPAEVHKGPAGDIDDGRVEPLHYASADHRRGYGAAV